MLGRTASLLRAFASIMQRVGKDREADVPTYRVQRVDMNQVDEDTLL